MKFLCLIHLNEHHLAAMPAAEMNDLNARHLAFNESLRASGHFVDAMALEPSRAAARLRLRAGKRSITDGPFTESKEMVAGFYLIEAEDMAEALEVASRIPSASLGTVDVWPTRQLFVDGVAHNN